MAETHTIPADNIELLLSRLPAKSLAWKLASACKQASPENVPAALETVLSERFEEIRNAIGHDKNKLD
jgi:hypothetical protein